MMHLLQKILFTMVLSLIFFNTGVAEEATPPTASIQVDGLSCPFCAYGLEKNLKKVHGVEAVNIDMKTGKATVTMKKNMDVTNQSLRQAVKKAGFSARDIIRQ